MCELPQHGMAGEWHGHSVARVNYPLEAGLGVDTSPNLLYRHIDYLRTITGHLL
jgi:hypothetical protein